MRRVCIGVPVREGVERLRDTLAALRSFTPGTTADTAMETIVLADGLDAAARARLPALGARRILAWARPLGDPACFNRLVGHGDADADADADVYVLLENGARVAPGWLEALLRALDADPAHGLTGPSTNRCWNEQQVFPGCAGDHGSRARAAAEAAARFGGAVASLAPLHSLADFCYAVTRETVRRVGAADEGYGEGPCWEMDYNLRAARAGLRGVWAPGAFVWRAPLGARRAAAEARLFAASKRRYQDHFCALRLRGEARGYEEHCRGDACEHFAPAALITIRRELPAPASAAARAAPTPTPAPTPAPAPAAAPPPAVIEGRPPLVSCIMPTANRRPYVAQAITAFQRQDYPSKELIIVDDGEDAVEDLVPRDDERVVYLRQPRGKSLGSKRNAACAAARGEVIVHWDDDDWHAAWRLSYQVGRLLGGDADICGLDRVWFYDPAARRGWQYRYPGGRQRWLAGGTFCYRARLWQRLRFPDVTAGEDTRFVREATFARLVTLDRDDFYVARIHAGNTCRKQTGNASWSPIARDTIERILAACAPSPAG